MKCATQFSCGLFFLSASLCVGNRYRDARSGLRGVDGSRKPRSEILEELERALGDVGKSHREETNKNVNDYEEALKATFNSLPKNDRGAIGAPSVRYALHRLFNQRHGWQIKGLESSGGAWDAASPMAAMGNYVHDGMRKLFDDWLDTYGLNLHELAVVAATMDNMFRLDVEKRLDIVLQSLGKDKNTSVPFVGALQVLTSYIGNLILGSRVELLTQEEVQQTNRQFDRIFPRSSEAKALLSDIMTKMQAESFDYEHMVSVAGAFGRQLGDFEDKECRKMKNLLLTREERPGNGRVRLDDFYDYKFSWHFSESVDYMRKHGALDESNPEQISVIIPNYLHLPGNCITPSGDYDICCFDECEAMMDHIEAEVAAPTASVERIASVVASLEVGRGYNRSGRDLTPTLQRLLGEIAEYHAGSVPIHGRLFSQWMHQAFPRECAHPSEAWKHDRFAAGGVEKTTAEERQKYYGQKYSAQKSGTWENDHTPIGVWQLHERLVDQKNHEAHIDRSSNMKDIMAFAAAGVIGTLLLQLMIGPSKHHRQKDLKLL